MKKTGDPDAAPRPKGYIFPRTGLHTRAATFGGALGRAGIIGLHPVSGLLVGGAAGYFLWKKFDAAWIFWVLLLLGFIAGCLNAYREARAYLREQEAAKK
ncbi:MAG: AtpZ/AtpI family protein [Deltaproteobacteria bacterium]|nr:AtpZ/AtpI family protein [Deltaproteobacteria bacterium]